MFTYAIAVASFTPASQPTGNTECARTKPIFCIPRSTQINSPPATVNARLRAGRERKTSFDRKFQGELALSEAEGSQKIKGLASSNRYALFHTQLYTQHKTIETSVDRLYPLNVPAEKAIQNAPSNIRIKKSPKALKFTEVTNGRKTNSASEIEKNLKKKG